MRASTSVSALAGNRPERDARLVRHDDQQVPGILKVPKPLANARQQFEQVRVGAVGEAMDERAVLVQKHGARFGGLARGHVAHWACTPRTLAASFRRAQTRWSHLPIRYNPARHSGNYDRQYRHVANLRSGKRSTRAGRCGRCAWQPDREASAGGIADERHLAAVRFDDHPPGAHGLVVGVGS